MSSRSCFVFYVLYILASFHKEEFRKFNLLIFPKVKKRMLRGTYFPFSTPFVQRVTNCTFLGTQPARRDKYILQLKLPAPPLLFHSVTFIFDLSERLSLQSKKVLQNFCHFIASRVPKRVKSTVFLGKVNFPRYGQWLGQTPIYSGDP